MSALTPSNGKYRRSWTLWGAQAVPSEKYKSNYDQIKWGNTSKDVVVEEKDLPGHYVIKIRTSQ